MSTCSNYHKAFCIPCYNHSIYRFLAIYNTFLPKKGVFVSILTVSNVSIAAIARYCWLHQWSVIPLRGDGHPTAPKAPALPSWKIYQSRRPDLAELNEWFIERRFSALGVVLGSVSRLAVLDLDAPEMAEQFLEALPDLARTFTVTSGMRHLPHYYFHIPPGLNVTSLHTSGGELRAAGHYVVGPGVTIQGRTWTIMHDTEPRTLSQSDLSRLVGFLRLNTCKKSAAPLKTAHSAISMPSGSGSAVISQAAVVRTYQRDAARLGRNNALFAAARLARDGGWSQSCAARMLINLHIVQSAPPGHAPESSEARRAEAAATIASVYTQPARDLASLSSPIGLPNAVRERLLQLGLDGAARVLDALLLVGFKAGQMFTAAQAYAAVAAYGVGRNTIYAVLKTMIDIGQAITGRKSPPPSPPLDADAASRCADLTKQCLFGRVSNPVKNRGRGRATHHYVMPAVETLCQWFGVTAASGDRLGPGDVVSPAAYRAALHAALIHRAPGQYSRAWLSRRLGISTQTCRRYERRAAIAAHPVYRTWPLSWHTLDTAIPDEVQPGQFVEDETGRRYPPLRELARKLLARGHRLLFRVQEANHYAPLWVESAAQPTDAPRAPAEQSPAFRVYPVIHGDVSAAPANPRRGGEHPFPATASAAKKLSPAASLPDESARAARQLYDALRALNPRCSLTRSAAADLVTQYGVSLVERGLNAVKRRRGIHNPAGFLRTWLRGEALRSGQPVERPANRKRKALTSEEWVRQLAASPYARFCVNADDLARYVNVTTGDNSTIQTAPT